ncbi:MAG: PspC domain-containing protein [Syntrophothermus sp.]
MEQSLTLTITRMEEETNKEPGKEEPDKTPEPEKAPEPGKLPEAEKVPEAERLPEAEKLPEEEKTAEEEKAEAPGTEENATEEKLREESGEETPREESSREYTTGEETAREDAAQEKTAQEARYEVPPPAEEAPYSRPIEHRRLYKSRKNRIIFGVCGGLGDYLNIDPVVIRLIFVLSFLIGGWGFLVYILAALIMPSDPRESRFEETEKETVVSSENSKIILGSALILLGLYALFRTTGILRFFSFFGITHEFIIPLILIALGIMLVVRGKSFLYKESPSGRKLYRSSSNRMIAGVCAGLGEYLNIDPTLVRIIWVILTFGSFGIGIFIYILFALLVPLDNEVNLEK